MSTVKRTLSKLGAMPDDVITKLFLGVSFIICLEAYGALNLDKINALEYVLTMTSATYFFSKISLNCESFFQRLI